MEGCCQCVKDKNFESNSQLSSACTFLQPDVVNVSKIKISKAIHNATTATTIVSADVVNVSKIKISKAIHNSETENGTYADSCKINSLLLLFLTPFSRFTPIMELIELSGLRGSSPSPFQLAWRSSISSISCTS